MVASASGAVLPQANPAHGCLKWHGCYRVRVRQDFCKILMQRVEGVLPGVAFIGEVTFQHCQRHRATVLAAIFNTPATGAMFEKFMTSVRYRPISSSGFRPSSRRRKSFKINESPYTTDVLLCSARSMAGSNPSAVYLEAETPVPSCQRPRQTRQGCGDVW